MELFKTICRFSLNTETCQQSVPEKILFQTWLSTVPQILERAFFIFISLINCLKVVCIGSFYKILA